jgi:hypothetical protein
VAAELLPGVAEGRRVEIYLTDEVERWLDRALGRRPSQPSASGLVDELPGPKQVQLP